MERNEQNWKQNWKVPPATRQMLHYINLKLALLGCPTVEAASDPEFDRMLSSLLANQQETDRLLADYLCPADGRIQDFLERYLEGVTDEAPKIPARTFRLDQAGLARALSLPPDRDEFQSDIIHSYRLKNGVLHNPKSERRTTHGIFHIVEDGLPIPDDKKGVPRKAYSNLLRLALTPPRELMRLPFTASQKAQAECWVSLLLRPIVCPEVPGYISEKRSEIRFFVPGNLVSNLDFVESIFGNAGDPYLPCNDAGLDIEGWTGHTGCVILAPHLTGVKKVAIGLPHWDDATERQRRDGMCWKDENELYNDGGAFKVACRDESGVMVTIITDNYFGYCKKEVKTQISFAANLAGHYEEEHAGGALVYQSYDLGEEYSGELHAPKREHSFGEVLELYKDVLEVQPEGHALDKNYPNIVYVPEDAHFDLQSQRVWWKQGDGEGSTKLLPGLTFVRPSGYRVQMVKPAGGRSWRLVGTVSEGTFCHKPCTVSGGGKSEISKSISDAILQGPVFVADFQKDFDMVEEIINRDYSDRFSAKYRAEMQGYTDSRPILSPQRSLGSVIKLLTPASRDFTDEYNDWLSSIPQHIMELVFVVKRFYKPEWEGNWREHFSVDIINGVPGNELKMDNRKLISSYLRVGYEPDGSWRVFGLRKDFFPAAKIATEDDISASIVVPADKLHGLNPAYHGDAVKIVKNCENRLFQRPDDAIHRGYDKQTENDFAQDANFFSNYEPLSVETARELLQDTIGFEKYTLPIQELIREVAQQESGFFVSPSHPRVVDGKPSKNPRYLQVRPDLLAPRDVYLSQMATRMSRRLPLGAPLYSPVNAVLPGRRNNPPEPGIRPLAVYNPIHYMELPELFMEFTCSMTGKSPSTTGAGSEGALTKGPFNALLPILDLNNALIAYVLTGASAFITATGYIGPYARMDHDISLLVPEVWCRMTPQERDPQFLIRNGYLEKCEDFEHDGQKVLTSRLGYRITRRFVKTYFGRVFNHPHVVFTEEMLRPEKQSVEIVVDGMNNIVETQRRVAEHYFNDGSVELACPPLRALLHIMKSGYYDGKALHNPVIRDMFTRESLLSSEWYKTRQQTLRDNDARLWQRHVAYLENFLAKPSYAEEARRLNLPARLEKARETLALLS
jgi:phosphoenolpyruvate carboxykinase (diphosphate)